MLLLNLRLCFRASLSRLLFQNSTVVTTAMSSNLNIKSRYRMNSGHEIPVLGFGVYQTPASVTQKVVLHAIKTGYRHVDSAIAYQNEAPSAAGLKDSGVPRTELFFTSKIPPRKMSYKDTKACVEATLKETGFEYIDLFLLHSPYGGKEGRFGAWKALVEACEAGKVRSIGVSNFGVHHLDELEKHIQEVDAKEGKGKGGIISVNQIELHPWLARKDIVRWCEERGIVVEAYSPLVQGERWNEPRLKELAQKHGKSGAQILLRWSLQQGFVTLPKSVTPSRIEENAAIFDFSLSDEDLASLDTGTYAPVCWDPTVATLDQ